jgi:hypothetical protein
MTKKLEDMIEALASKQDAHNDKTHEHFQAIHEKLNETNITLAKQAKDLEHHIHRTDLLEDRIEKHLDKDEEYQEKITDEIRANSEHRIKVLGFIKIGGGLLATISTILGLIYALSSLI